MPDAAPKDTTCKGGHGNTQKATSKKRSHTREDEQHEREATYERSNAREAACKTRSHTRERERERERGHIPEIMQATFSMSHTQQGLLTHIQHKSHTKRTHADAPKAVEYTVPGFLL